MKFYSHINYIFIIWVVLVLFTSYIGFSTLPHSGKFSNNFFMSFANWDGGHFLGIAQSGYSEKFQYAFFPLYPAAINLLSKFFQNFLTAGVLISVSATFFGLHLLFALTSFYFDKKIAEKTVYFFLFFPTSFFLLTVYSEGLFFLLAVLTFYLLQKKKLMLATFAAILVSATRLAGLAVVAGFLIEVWLTQGFNRKNWYIFLAPLGFVAYSIFLNNRTGDLFYFITAENHWQRILAVPGLGFWESLKNISMGRMQSTNFNIIIDLVFSIFGLGLILRSFRFLPVGLSIYGFFSILLPLFTPTLSSIPRFLLVIFPVFILMALVKNRYLQIIFQLFSVSLLAIFTALFFSGYWVS